MRKQSAALLLILVLSAHASPASADKGKGKKPKPYETTGHVFLPGRITWEEFDATCPAMPASQGVTGFVVKLPTEMLGRTDLVLSVKAVPPPPGLNAIVVFYDADCEFIVGGQAIGLMAVPPRAAFIETHDETGANYDVTLRVTASGVPPGTGSVRDRGSTPDPFRATGHVLFPGYVTRLEFDLASCPSMPLSQGSTGYVFALPDEMLNRADLSLEVEEDASLFHVDEVDFFDAACTSLGTTGAAGVIDVPFGAAFLEIHSSLAFNYDVTITVTASGVPFETGRTETRRSRPKLIPGLGRLRLRDPGGDP